MPPTEPKTKLVRSLRGGQVTIPAEFRRRLGITDDSVLQMTLTDGELRIRPVQVMETTPGSPWLEKLYEYFAPVREEIVAMGVSEQEVNEDIEAALRAVRAGHD